MDVAVSRVLAIGVLQKFFRENASMFPKEELERMTPEKVLRRYLAETTILKAKHKPALAAERTGAFWISLFATTSGFRTEARNCDLYKRFYKEVIAQAGLTLVPKPRASDHQKIQQQRQPQEGCVYPWQAMALFYMSGDSLEIVKAAIRTLGLYLTSRQAIILPLNVCGFCARLEKSTNSPDSVVDYIIDLADIGRNSKYCLVEGISMGDISPVPRDSGRVHVIVQAHGKRRLQPALWTQMQETLFQQDIAWLTFKKAKILFERRVLIVSSNDFNGREPWVKLTLCLLKRFSFSWYASRFLTKDKTGRRTAKQPSSKMDHPCLFEHASQPALCHFAHPVCWHSASVLQR